MSVSRVETTAEDHQQREKVLRLVILMLVGALVATLAAVVWLVQGNNSLQDDLDQAEADVASYAEGPDALAAAEKALGEIISYDYRDLDDEFDWTQHFAGELRTQYEDDLVPTFRKVIRRFRMTAEGEVAESAYDIVDSGTVQVIAFVRQSLSNEDNRKGVLDEQWTSLTMVRDGDTWLIEMITPLNVPPPSS
ncbi:hypothetical protein SFC88_06670 [Nocardioides sp. HM23]|nr:hypothetical protein [Nocardioides sp. HM23]